MADQAVPLLVTDQAVLAIIAKDDEIASTVDAAFKSAAANVPSGVALAWGADLTAYTAWAAKAKDRLEGGFFGGEWFGVVDDYNAAINWGTRLKSHAADATKAGATVATLPDLPPTATGAGSADLSLGADTKVLIGLGLGLGILFLLKK